VREGDQIPSPACARRRSDPLSRLCEKEIRSPLPLCEKEIRSPLPLVRARRSDPLSRLRERVRVRVLPQ